MLKILPQEESTGSQFNGPIYMTVNFNNVFGNLSYAIAARAIEKIKTERVPFGADYLQIFEFDSIRFWVLDDQTHVTVLMPEDY